MARPHSFKRWSHNEVQDALAMSRKGRPIREIAAILRRPYQSVATVLLRYEAGPLAAEPPLRADKTPWPLWTRFDLPTRLHGAVRALIEQGVEPDAAAAQVRQAALREART